MRSFKAIHNSKKKGKYDKDSEQATVQYLMKTLETLQKENEILKREVLKSNRTPSVRVGFALLVIGTLALVGSVIRTSVVLAFIGLGLTFWGALFLFARPIKFVRSTLLDSTAISSYTTIDRMTQDLKCRGRPIYIPPYPEEAYLPEFLKGLKEMIVFIPGEDTFEMPTIEEMARKQFLFKNPNGICIAPPGYGLVNIFEKELKAEFTQIDLERFYNSLPTIIVKNLELAKEIEIDAENDFTHIKITHSVYKDLYSQQLGLKSIHSIGCPLTSAIACALAKTTANIVAIIKDAVSPDLKTIEVWYKAQET